MVGTPGEELSSAEWWRNPPKCFVLCGWKPCLVPPLCDGCVPSAYLYPPQEAPRENGDASFSPLPLAVLTLVRKEDSGFSLSFSALNMHTPLKRKLLVCYFLIRNASNGMSYLHASFAYWGCQCLLSHCEATGDTVWTPSPAFLPVSQERGAPSPAGPAREFTASWPDISRKQDQPLSSCTLTLTPGHEAVGLHRHHS